MMLSKKRKTSFNDDWIKKFHPWLRKVESDDTKAQCTWCRSTFSIESRGEAAIKDHKSGVNHTRNEKSREAAQRYFKRKCKNNLLDFYLVIQIH